MDFNLPPQSIVFGDSAFTDYQWEDELLQEAGIEFAIQRKKKAKRGDSWLDALAKKVNRRIIEMSFSQITAHIPKRIQAVTFKGFQIKLFFAVWAFAIFKFLEL